MLDGQEEGFLRVHLREGTDRILGATLVAEHAGEMIGEITLAMTAGVGLGKIGATIHPYPTQSRGVPQGGRRVAPDEADAAGAAGVEGVVSVGG